jgi:transcriptional regulator with XRE-family HTH domain
MNSESGTRILLLRRSQKMTQKQLAEKVGTQPMQISRYERGDQKPGVDMLMKIAAVLGVEIGDLCK